MQIKSLQNLKEFENSCIYRPLDNTEIYTAVDLFTDSKVEAIQIYGPIEDWNTSNITNMQGLFSNKFDFNEDISRWDTSNVTNMSSMFKNARTFNQPIGSWNTSKVTDMNGIFWRAESFNQPLNSWDTSKVINMSYMFINARSFNQSLNSWDTSKVINMSYMFNGATSFNQDISMWNLFNLVNRKDMFISSGMNKNYFDIIKKKCNLDYCKNVGGRCYYMSVVALFHNIQSKIIYQDGFEKLLPFVNKLMKECLVRVDRIELCSNLPLEIQKTYRTYMQLYDMTSEIVNFEAKSIKEGGSSFKLLLSFLSQSNHNIYPPIPKIEGNINFRSEITHYYNQTLFNRNFVKLLKKDKNKIPITNERDIQYLRYLKNILNDEDSYFNFFRIKFLDEKQIFYNKIEIFSREPDGLFNFTSSINAIINFYNFLEEYYNHKKLLGGNFGIIKNQTISGGHALSYHICTDNQDEFKIILCDPNALDTCQIVYNILTKDITYYNTDGVSDWENVYFYEISFLLINTNYRPK